LLAFRACRPSWRPDGLLAAFRRPPDGGLETGGTFSTSFDGRPSVSFRRLAASSAKYGSISSASAIFWPLSTDMLCRPGERAREVLSGDQAHQLEEVSVRPALEAAPAAGG